MANVLIVDDEFSIQRMLSYILQREGHMPLTASNAGEALAQLKKKPVDLILLDIAMPDIDGIAFLSQLRAMPEYEQLPIVMLTANTNMQIRKAAEEAGATAFMNKLANPDELLSVLSELLGEV
ncbi:MAG: response regulator [Anaerolineae bacterium]|nr:response regulator [Anaerolineae bacterium]